MIWIKLKFYFIRCFVCRVLCCVWSTMRLGLPFIFPIRMRTKIQFLRYLFHLLVMLLLLSLLCSVTTMPQLHRIYVQINEVLLFHMTRMDDTYNHSPVEMASTTISMKERERKRVDAACGATKIAIQWHGKRTTQVTSLAYAKVNERVLCMHTNDWNFRGERSERNRKSARAINATTQSKYEIV